MTTDPVAFIQNRISEIDEKKQILDEEKQVLTNVLEHLTPPSRTASRGNGAPRRRKGGGRLPRGARQEEMLVAIQKNPDASPGELGKEIGISSSQAHVIVRKLEAAGKIKKTSEGFAVARS